MVADDYNYESFSRSFWEESSHFPGGARPGQSAPDFELPVAGGGLFRLSEFRGRRPVLIQFGSIT